MTSGCCASTASPSFCVQDNFVLIMLSTDGVATSDLTLSSQVCPSTAVLSCIALQVLVLVGPAARLDDLERIGRSHQRLRQQIVGIKRDRREKLIELLGLEQILGRRGCHRRRGRCRRSLRSSRIRQGCRASQRRCENPTFQRNHMVCSLTQQADQARIVNTPRSLCCLSSILIPVGRLNCAVASCIARPSYSPSIGHASAALPTRPRNFRRLMSAPRLRSKHRNGSTEYIGRNCLMSAKGGGFNRSMQHGS